ncbi:MAG: 30S ribosomal protein S2 [Candidatus Pacebacteria bacterium CG10_big_fil_rev_8_21_14_0_10_56_10]|nr:MAG: 30S ribosomal protein S2 [Candidatus Pacebacteria bacterium CG10_big_fil_rev_8_21_14_0_10_56_10]
MAPLNLSDLPDQAPEFDLQQMLAAGVHFGHQVRKWHPAMADWIYAEKEGVHIFDLVKTVRQLTIAYNYAYQLGADNKVLVMVATKRQAKDIVEQAAADSGAMFITSRWLGGTLTNWNQVKKSLQRMIDIEQGLVSGEYDHYTKFERNQLEKEQGRLERFFRGIKALSSLPDALFIVDPRTESIAVKEAIKRDVPLIALIDSNTDPRPIDIPIPANDDAMGSIEFIVQAVAAGYRAGKSDRPTGTAKSGPDNNSSASQTRPSAAAPVQAGSSDC